MKKRLLALILAGLLVFTALSGCGTNPSPTPSTAAPTPSGANSTVEPSPTEAPMTYNGIDVSKPVDLVCYLIGGPESTGMPAVMDAANKILKDKINATFSVQYIDWGNYESTYASILAAGTGVDVILSGDWLSYGQQVQLGAFYPLSKDDLAKYAPNAVANIPQEGWDASLVNGVNYLIPSEPTIDANNYFLVRGDLIKKYNLAVPTGYMDLEPYFKAIKDNEPDMIPFNGSADEVAQGSPFWLFIGHQFSGIFPSGGSGVFAYTDVPDLKPMGLLNDFESAVLQGAKMAKDWYDKGYINQAILSADTGTCDNFVNGRSGIAFGNTTSLQPYAIKAAELGYEPILIAKDSWNAKGMAPDYVGGMSVAATCKNPERAMMFLDLMMFDPELSMLLYNGIEGVNYVMDGDKKALPPGVTADTNTYSGEAQGFWVVPLSARVPDAGLPDQYIQVYEKVQTDYNHYQPRAGFTLNADAVSTEAASVASVWFELLPPLQAGAVGDVDKAWAELKQKMMDAGWQKLYDTAVEQVNAFNAGK